MRWGESPFGPQLRKMNDNPRKILVIGTGRSGTNHFARVCNGLGMEVGHEEMKPDGISSWCLVSDLSWSPYGPARSELDLSEFATGHQLRHPVKTIPSLMTMNKSSWRFISEDASGRVPASWWRRAPFRAKAMWHWLDWNQRAEQMADMHWTLKSASGMGPALAAQLNRPALESAWADGWAASDRPTNDANSRISGWNRLWTTSPTVAVRRWLHAKGRIAATEEALHKADAALAKDVLQYWETFDSKWGSGAE